jgi:hypothetical protein
MHHACLPRQAHHWSDACACCVQAEEERLLAAQVAARDEAMQIKSDMEAVMAEQEARAQVSLLPIANALV